MTARLWRLRYLFLRRLTQFGVLVLFYGTAHWGWTVAGAPLLRGNLSASELLGTIPLADPFATLQLLATGHLLEFRVLLGALITLAVYGLLGGRVFCSWVCPINPVTDLAGRLRRALGIRSSLHIGRGVRLWMLALAFVLSAMVGVAAFEWISPIGMTHRSLILGLGAGWFAAAVVFLFDLLLVSHGWCGHLCPLGAFYGLVGRVAQVRVAFDADACTHCGECGVVCHEPQVLNLKLAGERGMIVSGDCTNCGRCASVCPEDALGFAWRPAIKSAVNNLPNIRTRRAS